MPECQIEVAQAQESVRTGGVNSQYKQNSVDTILAMPSMKKSDKKILLHRGALLPKWRRNSSFDQAKIMRCFECSFLYNNKRIKIRSVFSVYNYVYVAYSFCFAFFDKRKG